jgi:hypothetical protein
VANPMSSAPGAESRWIEWLLIVTAQVATAGAVPTPAAVAAIMASTYDLAVAQVQAWLAGCATDDENLAHMALLRADLCNGDWDRRSRQIQETAA